MKNLKKMEELLAAKTLDQLVQENYKNRIDEIRNFLATEKDLTIPKHKDLLDKAAEEMNEAVKKIDCQSELIFKLVKHISFSLSNKFRW